jgi:hypothetical protein
VISGVGRISTFLRGLEGKVNYVGKNPTNPSTPYGLVCHLFAIIALICGSERSHIFMIACLMPNRAEKPLSYGLAEVTIPSHQRQGPVLPFYIRARFAFALKFGDCA